MRIITGIEDIDNIIFDYIYGDRVDTIQSRLPSNRIQAYDGVIQDLNLIFSDPITGYTFTRPNLPIIQYIISSFINDFISDYFDRVI